MMKDGKENFVNNPSRRLLNPTKSDLGMISKRILDNITSAITQQSSLNLWKNTQAVIQLFENIKNKEDHSFIVFDIVEYYPLITSEILNKAPDYASSFITIQTKTKE